MEKTRELIGGANMSRLNEAQHKQIRKVFGQTGSIRQTAKQQATVARLYAGHWGALDHHCLMPPKLRYAKVNSIHSGQNQLIS
jgi:hypothetical protein